MTPPPDQIAPPMPVPTVRYATLSLLAAPHLRSASTAALTSVSMVVATPSTVIDESTSTPDHAGFGVAII